MSGVLSAAASLLSGYSSPNGNPEFEILSGYVHIYGVIGFLRRGRHPARAGGPWLCSILVLSLFHAVVVPSGFRTTVQPLRWISTW